MLVTQLGVIALQGGTAATHGGMQVESVSLGAFHTMNH
jgi:hypothetical protein